MRKFHILLISSFLLSSCLSKSSDLNVTTTSVVNSAEQEKELVERNGFCFHGIAVPDEIMIQIFSHLPVKDITQASQVCQGWYQLSEDPALWRIVRLHIHGDYPASEATKEQAKLHMLRVQVHTLTDLNEIERLITKYELNKYRPFVRYQILTYRLLKRIKGLIREVVDEQAIQGNERAIERKMKGLSYPTHGYKRDHQAAFAYNEHLIKQGNSKAIGRKTFGLANGFCGYKEDGAAAFSFNEYWVEQGNEKAIAMKMRGLAHGAYNYKENLAAAYSLNEYWVEQGSIKAIERKVWGLDYARYGYGKDRSASFALNEQLVGQGNCKAIKRKLEGLINGFYGYEEDLEAALAFNEQLVEQGNEVGISRKIIELSKIKHIEDEDDEYNYLKSLPLYQPDSAQLKKWVEEESNKGTRWACYLKAKGLKYGILGYEKNQEAAIAYIKQYHIPY